jgi:hypothetical protein
MHGSKMKFLKKYTISKTRGEFYNDSNSIGFHSGDSIYVYCCNHIERTPSLRVSEGRAYCYGCGESYSHRKLGHYLKQKYKIVDGKTEQRFPIYIQPNLSFNGRGINDWEINNLDQLPF